MHRSTNAQGNITARNKGHLHSHLGRNVRTTIPMNRRRYQKKTRGESLNSRLLLHYSTWYAIREITRPPGRISGSMLSKPCLKGGTQPKRWLRIYLVEIFSHRRNVCWRSHSPLCYRSPALKIVRGCVCYHVPCVTYIRCRFLLRCTYFYEQSEMLPW